MGKKQNPFRGKDILSIEDFSPGSLTYLFEQANYMRAAIGTSRTANTLAGSVVALLFFEPSTRTHNSFSASAQRLGAGVIGIQDTGSTSMFKGESFEDTITMMSGYSDALVIRHKEPGSAMRAADVSPVPVLNGGDGGNEHPTQMALDLYTVFERFGKLNNITCVAGVDPLHSRVIRSFLLGLSQYKNNTAYVLSSSKLRLSRDLYKKLVNNGLKIIEIDNERDIPGNAHVWYWNRIQSERFSSVKEFSAYRKKYVITPELLAKKGNDDMIIMDALPRVGEISTAVDRDPRAYYFTQAKNGMYIRMALLKSILEKKA